MSNLTRNLNTSLLPLNYLRIMFDMKVHLNDTYLLSPSSRSSAKDNSNMKATFF